jgi:hypothetical protein
MVRVKQQFLPCSVSAYGKDEMLSSDRGIEMDVLRIAWSGYNTPS